MALLLYERMGPANESLTATHIGVPSASSMASSLYSRSTISPDNSIKSFCQEVPYLQTTQSKASVISNQSTTRTPPKQQQVIQQSIPYQEAEMCTVSGKKCPGQGAGRRHRNCAKPDFVEERGTRVDCGSASCACRREDNPATPYERYLPEPKCAACAGDNQKLKPKTAAESAKAKRELRDRDKRQRAADARLAGAYAVGLAGQKQLPSPIGMQAAPVYAPIYGFAPVVAGYNYSYPYTTASASGGSGQYQQASQYPAYGDQTPSSAGGSQQREQPRPLAPPPQPSTSSAPPTRRPVALQEGEHREDYIRRAMRETGCSQDQAILDYAAQNSSRLQPRDSGKSRDDRSGGSGRRRGGR